MVYVILDPGYDYAAYMVSFLNEYDRKGIAVFTDEGQYHSFQNGFKEKLGACLVDEYLVSEFPNLQALAETILDEWEEEEIEGIIPWAEFTIELGAELGEYLGLDWNPREVIHRFRNKYALKDYLRHNCDLRINASRLVSNEEEAMEFQEYVGRWPIVVKPTEGAGSKKVFFAENQEQLIGCCVEVFQGGMGEVLLEEYVGGTEYVINGITDAAHDVLITDSWHYDKRESHGFKNLYYQTMKVGTSDPVFQTLALYAGQLIEALGLRKSPFHMEIKLDEYGPCIIECGARFAGGNQPLLASKLHERSLFELAACHYMADLPLHLGDVHYDRYDQFEACIVNGIQTHNLECIHAVHGIDRVEALPSFFMIGFTRPPGSFLSMTTDLFTKSYEVYLLNENLEQILEDAADVRDLLWYD